MKKFYLLIPTLILCSCGVKSTPKSEALLEEIYKAQSITKADVNYRDYQKFAQNLQIKLDNFEREKVSQKLKYAGNLAATVESYIEASEKSSSEWEPESDWRMAEKKYATILTCQEKGQDCYALAEKFSLNQDLRYKNAIKRLIVAKQF